MTRDLSPGGRLVVGAAAFGQPYGTGADRRVPDDSTVAALLELAIAGGVTHVDTARAYGASETTLGRVLSAAGLTSVKIVSKVRPLDDLADDAPAEQVATAVRGSVEDSLAALGRAEVDVMLLHRARDAERAAGAAQDALTALVSEGVVGRWGVSVGSPSELLAALSYPGVTYVQLPFNLLDRRWLDDEVQEALSARPDVHVTVRSALLQGLLASSDGRAWPQVAGVDPTYLLTTLDELVKVLGRRDRLDLCLGYVLGHRWVDSIVLGVRRVEQLSQLVDSVALPPLGDADLARVHAAVPPGPDELVDPWRWTFADTRPPATPRPPGES